MTTPADSPGRDLDTPDAEITGSTPLRLKQLSFAGAAAESATRLFSNLDLGVAGSAHRLFNDFALTETKLAGSAAQFVAGLEDTIYDGDALNAVGLAGNFAVRDSTHDLYRQLADESAVVTGVEQMYRDLAGDAATRIGGAFSERAVGGILESYHDVTRGLVTGVDPEGVFSGRDYSNLLGAAPTTEAFRDLVGEPGFAADESLAELYSAREHLNVVPIHDVVRPPDMRPIAEDQLEAERQQNEVLKALLDFQLAEAERTRQREETRDAADAERERVRAAADAERDRIQRRRWIISDVVLVLLGIAVAALALL